MYHIQFLITCCSAAGLVSLGIVDIWGRIVLCCGYCPVHLECLVVSLVSVHWMPVAPLTPFLSCDNEKCLQTLPDGLQGAKLSRLRTSALKKSSLEVDFLGFVL